MKEPLRIHVEAGSSSYPVVVGKDLLPRLGGLLREAGLSGRVALVADERVFPLWGEAALASLSRASVFRIPAGEEAKTLPWAERLWGELAFAGFGRSDVVVALGGGATGDLAGFVAATYHRGMPLVQVPTTLLSQVDSSVGGKTAIDHPLGKNLVGAFHQPRLVVAALETLDTLPTRQRWAGLAEIVKAALIADADLLSLLEGCLEDLATGASDEAAIASVVERAIRIKAHVVAKDERDHGVRRILNFGHTLGHALEAATGFSAITHGEAVVLGMKGAIHVSESLGRLGGDEAKRARGLLSRFPIPPFQRPGREELLAIVRRDKKAEAGRCVYIGVGPLGEAWTHEAGDPLLLEAMGEMLDG